MEVMMRADTNREKDLSGIPKEGRPSWYVVTVISMIALALTACTSPVKLRSKAYDLANEGRYSEAVAILEPMAENGDFKAQTQIVYLYRMNISDPTKEVYWLLKLVQNPEFKANQDFLSLVRLAERYRDGKGVAKDFMQACNYYKQSMEIRESGYSRGIKIRDIVDKCTSAGMFSQTSLIPTQSSPFPSAQPQAPSVP